MLFSRLRQSQLEKSINYLDLANFRTLHKGSANSPGLRGYLVEKNNMLLHLDIVMSQGQCY